MQPHDSLGSTIQDTLYHLKSIEHRLAWSKCLCEMRPQDKHKINQVITRVKSGIMDIAMIVPNTDLQRRILDDVNNDSRMVYFMALVEMLYCLPEEMLGEVTDLVDTHLKRYEPKGQQVPSHG